MTLLKRWVSELPGLNKIVRGTLGLSDDAAIGRPLFWRQRRVRLN
jgi:hypothetical protein